MAPADPSDAWLRDRIGTAGVVIDALFGVGLDRPLGPADARVVAAVNASGSARFAVDVPSGLDCDTGRPLGPTVRATHTATFVAPKAGFDAPEARPYLGELFVVALGVKRG